MKKQASRTMEDPTRNVDGAQLRRELRRAAVWTALVLAAVVAVYYLALAPLTDPLDPRASRWEEDAYTNRALGLRFTLPEGWEFLDELPAAEGLAAGMPEDGSLLMAAGGPGGVNVQLRCTPGTGGAVDTDELRRYVDALTGQLPLENTQSEWREARKIGAVSYETLYVRGMFMDLDMEAYVLVGVQRRQTALIFVIGNTALEPEQYLAAFSGA